MGTRRFCVRGQRVIVEDSPIDLGISLGDGGKAGALTLPSPVIIAAGLGDIGRLRSVEGGLAGVGAVVAAVVGGRTYRGRRGPRLLESPAGILVDTDYPMLSAARLAERVAPAWSALDVPVIVHLRVVDAADGRALAFALEDVSGIAAIELGFVDARSNAAGEAPPPEPVELRAVVGAVLAATTRPVIVKLSPAWPDLPRLARAAASSDVAALCIGGALPASAPAAQPGGDAAAPRPWGLAGPAIRPLVLRAVEAVLASVRVPVIAGGGVTCGADALAYLAAGARAVQIGSALLADPRAGARVAAQIADYGTETRQPVLGGAAEHL